MREILNVLLLAIILSGCKKDNNIVQPTPFNPSCDELECPVRAEFYGVGLLNGECWAADLAYIYSFESVYLSVTLAKNEVNGIGEQLRFSINYETNLLDTIWLGWQYSNNLQPQIARARYYYTEGHALAGGFNFSPESELTYKDYLLIDYFNADTSRIEGRFQVRFPRRSVSGFVTHAPDSMRIQCGSFRAKAI